MEPAWNLSHGVVHAQNFMMVILSTLIVVLEYLHPEAVNSKILECGIILKCYTQKLLLDTK